MDEYKKISISGITICDSVGSEAASLRSKNGGIAVQSSKILVQSGEQLQSIINIAGPNISIQSYSGDCDAQTALTFSGKDGLKVTKDSSLAFPTCAEISEDFIKLSVSSSVDESASNAIAIDCGGIYAEDAGTRVRLFEACAGRMEIRDETLHLVSLESRPIVQIPLAELYSARAAAHAAAGVGNSLNVGAVRLLGLKDQDRRLKQNLIISPDAPENDIAGLCRQHGLLALRMASVIKNGTLSVLASGVISLDGTWAPLNDALLEPGGMCAVLAVRIA